MAYLRYTKKIAGIVLDGPIRDIDEIGNWDFPVVLHRHHPGASARRGQLHLYALLRHRHRDRLSADGFMQESIGLTTGFALTAIAYVVGGIVYVSYVDGYYRKLRGNSGK